MILKNECGLSIHRTPIKQIQDCLGCCHYSVPSNKLFHTPNPSWLLISCILYFGYHPSIQTYNLMNGRSLFIMYYLDHMDHHHFLAGLPVVLGAWAGAGAGAYFWAGCWVVWGFPWVWVWGLAGAGAGAYFPVGACLVSFLATGAVVLATGF
jgi:hypothetical protein